MEAMIDWLNRNGQAVQALAGVLTVVLALAALIGVKVQIDASDRLARAQSARDIYREFLSLSVQNADLANGDFCGLKKAGRSVAYDDYLGYMLYMAEQVEEEDASWRPVIDELFDRHTSGICSIDNLAVYGENIAAHISAFQQSGCKIDWVCQ